MLYLLEVVVEVEDQDKLALCEALLEELILRH